LPLSHPASWADDNAELCKIYLLLWRDAHLIAIWCGATGAACLFSPLKINNPPSDRLSDAASALPLPSPMLSNEPFSIAHFKALVYYQPFFYPFLCASPSTALVRKKKLFILSRAIEGHAGNKGG